MKQLLKLFLCLCIFGSCGDHQPAARKPAPTLSPLQKDTGTASPVAANPYEPIDVSPMDISYFPVDYPIAKMSKPGMVQPLARVIYSRPHKQGRKIFGSLLKYGEHWRLGANEATEIELYRDATIQNKRVAKGRYIMYSIPQPDSWTIVLNSNVYSWGLKQDSTYDKYRFKIPAEKTDTPVEFYTMVFQKTAKGADLLMAWDEVAAKLPISF